MSRGFTTIASILLSALVALLCLKSPALAAPDEDLQTLEMFYDGRDLVVSATRSPKPISQTAENITVVTAADIEMMGAHTLSDVLNNVPGLQTDDRGSVGTVSGLSIQGADPHHILVLQDGVTLNYFGEGTLDIATIPVQQIERIEIIKGPGSSSWGSALGGVVNIVTKSPLEAKRLSGALSFSAGERETRDSRGEVSGTIGSIGYYLNAGNLTTNGFRPQTAVDDNSLYAKLRWEIPERGSLLYTLAYIRDTRGDGQVTTDDALMRSNLSNFLSTLSLNYPLGGRADLDLSLRTTSKPGEVFLNAISTGDLIQQRAIHESTVGGSARLAWRNKIQNLAVGGDFDHVDAGFTDSGPLLNILESQRLHSEKWGMFLNDTLTFGDLAITPGIRYDRTSQVGGFFSPSLGATWAFNDKTVLRGYAARGYGLPFILDNATQIKVTTFQAGIETTQFPYLWLKATLFRNCLSDVQVFNFIARTASLEKQLKQGVEVEARTVPLFNTSLSAGYTFIDATDRETGEVLQNIPRQIAKLGLHYDDLQHSFRGALLGRYVWWNASSDNNASYKPIIWDLNITKRIVNIPDIALELFFSAHNLFNGAQYNNVFLGVNARRWLEGGIKFDF